ncbi:MAG: [FeFe] hydrogenase H-cluster radical SAM maturase HydE [Candidatus Gastranaerophilaceae bacterium]
MELILEKARKNHILSKDEIVSLLSNDDINEALFKSADEVRQEFVGDEVHLRALIEFTNICRCNCFYCGLRSENKNAERYRLTEKEIIDCAKNAVEFGYKTIVLQGGEDSFFTADYLGEIISEIKQSGAAITLSIGERTYEEYRHLKECGADRFLLRIETTDENLYKKMHPNMSLQNRKKCLYDLKKIGFETGTGSLVGLPGQTLESLADDILFFKELDADMIGIGPFIAHPDTPLKDASGNNFMLALKVMAITRILMPDINIPATTAMETLFKNGRTIALKSGANVIMPNVTDGNYRKKYEIYPGKVSVDYSAVSAMLNSINRTVGKDKGFRKKIV